MSQNTHKRDIYYSSDSGHPWEEKSVSAAVKLEAGRAEVMMENSKGTGEFIFGRSLKWYQEAAAWPMFILLMAEIGARVLASRYFPLLSDETLNILVEAFHLAMLVYLAVSVLKHYGASYQQALAALSLAGLVTGFLLALFQLFWYLELWTLFNLIGQPLVLAVEGAVVGWAVKHLFFKQIK